MKRTTRELLSIAPALALALAALTAQPALAHERAEVGPYLIVVGWENEPVIVGERNALVIEVTEDETPVEGLEATVDLVVNYAGRTFTGNLTPTGTPGVYSAEIFPTVRGQYEIHLSGAIRDESLDVTVEPEEVLSAGVLQFPETEPQPRDLQADITDLEARLQTATIIAIAGVVLGLAGLGLAAFSLRRAPRP